MKIYTVTNENGYYGEFYNLSAAKKAMKEFDGRGLINKVWANGDWEPMGEIKLKGSNATMVAGATRQTKANYI